MWYPAWSWILRSYHHIKVDDFAWSIECRRHKSSSFNQMQVLGVCLISVSFLSLIGVSCYDFCHTFFSLSGQWYIFLLINSRTEMWLSRLELLVGRPCRDRYVGTHLFPWKILCQIFCSRFLCSFRPSFALANRFLPIAWSGCLFELVTRNLLDTFINLKIIMALVPIGWRF